MPIYTPAPRHALPGPTITPWSKECNPVVVNAPTSGTWTANKAWFWPITVLDPFTVQKVFWANGATVGTDSIDMAIYEMTDLTTGRCDMIRSIGTTLSAGANACQEVGTWRTARTNLLAATDNTDATSYTTASVTLKTGRLYVLTVVNTHGTSASDINSVTGGPTWGKAKGTATIQYDTNRSRVSCWTAVPTVDYTGTLVIDFSGVTQTGAIWSLNEMSGVDTSTDNGVVQAVTNTGTSTTTTVTLSAFSSANNATFGAFGTSLNQSFTPGTGFTELSDTIMTSPNQGMETEWRVDNDTSVDAVVATSSVPYGAIGLEIKADTSSFIIPAKANIYGAFVVSGGTATIIHGVPSATTTARQQGMLELTNAFPLASTLTPVALTTIKYPLAGFSRRSLLA